MGLRSGNPVIVFTVERIGISIQFLPMPMTHDRALCGFLHIHNNLTFTFIVIKQNPMNPA